MQVAIDNAKRKFDVDLNEEIKRIKADMDLKNNGYPAFWTVIRKGFNKDKVNEKLICPMNYVFDVKQPHFKPKKSTLPMSTFFVKYELEETRRRSKKVEDLIQKYSLDLYNDWQSHIYTCNEEDAMNENELLLRSDFNDLIKDIKNTYISKNYLGLMSWLINRAFRIGSGVKQNIKEMKSTINNNKSILLKILYEVNSEALLKCFAGNIRESEHSNIEESQKSQ